MILEADKFQDLQGESTNYRLGTANGIILVCRLAEKACVLVESKNKQKLMSQLEGGWAQGGRRVSLFMLLRLSNDWMRPVLIREGNLLPSLH